MTNLKLSINQYRAGGLYQLWCDGLYRDLTLAVVADIRSKGFKCWRTGDQVWVLTTDFPAMGKANVKTGLE